MLKRITYPPTRQQNNLCVYRYVCACNIGNLLSPLQQTYVIHADLSSTYCWEPCMVPLRLPAASPSGLHDQSYRQEAHRTDEKFQATIPHPEEWARSRQVSQGFEQ